MRLASHMLDHLLKNVLDYVLDYVLDHMLNHMLDHIVMGFVITAWQLLFFGIIFDKQVIVKKLFVTR